MASAKLRDLQAPQPTAIEAGERDGLPEALPDTSADSGTVETVREALDAVEQPTEPDSQDALTPIRAPLTGKCDCPYDYTTNGKVCGERSAYSRPGGRDPVCYKGKS